ncbi:hypothetical protein JI747_012245 [Chryseobacterium sp. RG1]|uniref:Uncharacterized protein n=1 Tax=Chryseobacterium tagetis TaxID=2801334 RepID=A0ABS8A1U4_9FLAO|nr:hypothetical protein [Chryseobacterium tagetis]MCA6067956.1 hypothetical protein [Chryseobacterium tagetis]
MNTKRIGNIIIAALALTPIILFIDINFYDENGLTSNRFNEILGWSLIRALTISLAVNIGNYYRVVSKNKSN